MPWHIIRLWLLLSLATVLAGMLLAPAPARADAKPNHAAPGSPVFDDEWEMVALHHSGVPSRVMSPWPG